MTDARGGWKIPSLRLMLAVATSPVSLMTVALGNMSEWATAAGTNDLPVDMGSHEIMLTATLTGVVTVAVVSAIGMMRSRAKADEAIARLSHENADLKLRVDRAEALLNAEDQVILTWNRPQDPPILTGSLGSATSPKARSQFLAFGAWLASDSAARLERAIGELRERGSGFQLELDTHSGGAIEAIGRAGGGRPFVRFRDLSQERRQHAELKDQYRALTDDVTALKALLDALDMPVWAKGTSGRVTWVNQAYARALESSDKDEALKATEELLDSQGRKTIARLHETATVVTSRLPMVVAGQRRLFDIVDVATANGSVGLATDVSALESIQAELRRTIDFHARTLDQLATAVAIFGADKRLQFYNAAYRALWGLDPAFLEGAPEDGVVLDEIRAGRKLPEQADWRSWKREMLSAYQSLEAREFWWHLPDGQTLRVIANPHPQGGVTYVYENVTERLELEKKHNALVRVQGETLDHLSEGVAVFGSDGRLRLWNPAFAALWKVERAKLVNAPHISDVILWCRLWHEVPETWQRLQQAVAGVADSRTRLEGRMDRRDGSVLDYSTVPLPDGATLLTFVNITDTANVERALTEKAEALMEADRTKTDFVGLVSYELRSPLTNIIGFAELLNDPKFGDLNPKQQDYTRHILTSSHAVKTIIDDILDLATVDAGIMRLDVSRVDIAATVWAAVEGVKDRIEAGNLTLTTNLPADLGAFDADEKRVRQILFNLIANAVRFSFEGGTVTVTAGRQGGDVVFSVADQGSGIPQDQIRSVFDRFYARRQGPHRSGAGLGLSVVKSFVELHGGEISIDSTEGRGTTVTCRFPSAQVTHEDPRRQEISAHG